jgi:uncharacterized tellurite resistance protein B-like protein
MIMGLMDKYSKKERIASIAFLKIVAHSDHILKPEEEQIIDLLSKNVYVDASEIVELGDLKLKQILKAMTKEKTLELLRMGYTILDIDNDIDLNEIKILDFLATEHNIDLEDDEFIYSVIYGSKEYTPLDKIVLISFAYQMMFADSKVHKEEMKILNDIAAQMGLDMNEVKGLIVPIDTLIKAVTTMSKPSVHRILKELVHIAMSDGELSKDEFDIIFPLLSEFNIDFESLINKT